MAFFRKNRSKTNEKYPLKKMNLFLNCNIGSGAVALAHLDGNGTDEAVSTMVHRVNALAFGYPEGRIELQLIGGYRDQPGGYAEDLFYNIMRK